MFNFKSKFLTAKTKLADGSEELNGLTIIPLENFVKSSSKFAAPVVEDEIERDEPATTEEKPKKPEKKEPKPHPRDNPEYNTPVEERPDFGLGSTSRPIPEEEMRDYLGRIENEDKTKLDPYKMPYIHHNNIKIVDGTNNEYDLAALKAAITKRPSTILRQNEKMQHSDGHMTQFFNVGLPALKGLAVNEKTGEFVVVDTCPGSGSCKTFCYAMRGNYVMFKDTSMLQTQTLNFLLNDPKGFETRLKAEIAKEIKNKEKRGIEVVIRWHDAGDFFSPQYMKLAFNVAQAFPNNDFYAYTKMAAVANATKPANFIINFSEGATPRENKQVQLTQIKHSVVVPQPFFWDLIATKGGHTVKNEETGQVQFKDKASWNEFKDRLVAKYHINKDTILSFNEYMEMKKRDKLGDQQLRWNVVVPPGGGDNSANDPLVLGSYLMWH